MTALFRVADRNEHIAALEAEVVRLTDNYSELCRDNDVLDSRCAEGEIEILNLEAEVERLREALGKAVPQLATMVAGLEPYRDADGWGVNVTTDDIVIWSSLSAIADNLALALEPEPTEEKPE